MKPSIGCTVHYINGVIHLPAIITAVWNNHCVNLNIFNDGSYKMQTDLASFLKTSVMMGEISGTWHWPEIEG